jgi:hypothetical protein
VQARNTFNYLIGQLTDPAAETLTHDHLEELLTAQGRELQRQLLQAHLDLRARREQQAVSAAREQTRHGGTGVVGADKVVRCRVETGHHRLLATVFGTVRVTRCAWRAPNAANLYPADVALSLPGRRHSAGLARLAVAEAVRGSFEVAHAAITARCGPVIGKRQIEDLILTSAQDIDAFYAAQTPGAAHLRGTAGAQLRRQGHHDASRRAAPGHRQGRRPGQANVSDPAGRWGETGPQADGHPGGGLRRGPRTASPA